MAPAPENAAREGSPVLANASATAPWGVSAILENETLSSLTFSSCAAFVTRTITHPLDTLKTRIQNSKRPLGLAGALREAPFLSLYRGIGVSLAFSVPALSLYLTSYDYFKRTLGRFHEGKGEGAVVVHGTSAAFAECISGFFWTPMEILKSKLQVRVDSQGNPTGVPTSALSLARDIYRNDGFRGFFKGYWISLAVFVPYTVIYFITYEQLKHHLSNLYSPRQRISQDASPPTPNKIPFGVYLVSSASAGAVAGAISNFVDVVKTRIQVGGGYESGRGMLSVVRQMYLYEGGFKAFTKGLAARVLWLAPSVTISMTVFEVLKDARARALNL
ncbi:hypothetical protein HDU96_009180 [Phlyctochytrium bullatum]|nr:hypothetical protein HDU96_009180 [Phlyctochytrium bullatum]